jgi:hypothetical protein
MRSLGLVLIAAGALLAGDAEPTQAQIDDIIQKFAAHEAQFAKAREDYTYRQTARIQELDEAGNTTGRWEVVADVIFNSEGRRTEHVVRSPVPNLSQLILTPEDMEDLKSVQPFVLTTDQLSKYQIRYLGRQKVDEIGTYVFAVKPVKLEGKQRYFQGEVWVDDRDLQIVKSYGRGVGTANKGGKGQQFPKFETYREQIDGKFWFPTYTIANDTLHFNNPPQDVRMKQTVKYEDYKRFKAESTITFGETADEKKDKPPVKKP